MKNPLQISWRTEYLSLVLLAAVCVSSFFFFANFPELVPTHWNFAGQVDGWSNRAFAAFFLPALIIGIYALMLFLPQLDPYRDNYKKFNRYYHNFKNIIVAFLSILYFVAGLVGLGYSLPMDFYVPYIIGLLFILIGWQLRHVKRNWFLGLRTPWSLSSDKVWEETHRFGGFLFMAAGALMALNGLLPSAWRAIMLILVVLLLLGATVFASYYYYRRDQR